MQKFSLQLIEHDIKLLDKLCKSYQVKRPIIFRMILEHYIENDAKIKKYMEKLK